MIFFCEFATSDVDGAVGKDENSTPTCQGRIGEESSSLVTVLGKTNLVGTFRRFEPAGERSSCRKGNGDLLFRMNSASVEAVEETTRPFENPVVVDEGILHDLSNKNESSN